VSPKLHVIMRINPGLSKNTHTDFIKYGKRGIILISLKSLKDALTNVDYKITFIVDYKEESDLLMLKQLIESVFEDFKIIENFSTEEHGEKRNRFTFKLQLMEAMKSNTDYVYIVEDDYLYLRSLVNLLFLFEKYKEVDYVTPYDHPDYYVKPWHEKYQKRNFEVDGDRFRSVSSTALTFFARASTLKEDVNTFNLYSKTKLMDYEVWLLLTKLNGSSLTYKRTALFILYKILYINNITKKQRTLVAPYRTFAIHMAKEGIPSYLSIDQLLKIVNNYLK